MNVLEWCLLATVFVVFMAFKIGRYQYFSKLAMNGEVDSIAVWIRSRALFGIATCCILSPLFYIAGHRLIAALVLIALVGNLIYLLARFKCSKWFVSIYDEDTEGNSRKPE